MKWTPVLINWDIGVRPNENYSQEVTESEDASLDTIDRMESESRLVEMRKVVCHPKYSIPIGPRTNLPPISESNLQYCMKYEYKAPAADKYCYCDYCLAGLEINHINIIKTRNILYVKLIALAKINLKYRERYSELYFSMTGYSVKFSDMPLPTIDDSCYSYQRPAEIALGICHFRRRYERLEACHIKTIQTKNLLRQEIDAMVVKNQDLQNKCDALYKTIVRKVRDVLPVFDESYVYDPKSTCCCTRECSHCRIMLSKFLDKVMEIQNDILSKIHTLHRKCYDFIPKYEELLYRVTGSLGLGIRNPIDIYEEHPDRFVVDPEDCDLYRRRGEYCGYCHLESTFMAQVKYNNYYNKRLDTVEEYYDKLLRGYETLQKLVIRVQHEDLLKDLDIFLPFLQDFNI